MVTRSSRSFHKACIWSRTLGWQVVHGSLHIDSLDYHCELLAAWLRFFQFETLSSEGNENGKKNKQTNKQTARSLTGKKKPTTLHVQHTFIVHFYTCQLFLRYKREIFILGVLGFLKTTRSFPKIPEEVRSLPKTSEVCRSLPKASLLPVLFTSKIRNREDGIAIYSFYTWFSFLTWV